jgi:hypothetical protein
VSLIWLPSATTVGRLAELGLSPGVMSAGLGSVPARQTYLDIGQGNRVFDSLYDSELPEFSGNYPSWWSAVEDRAESAPAEIDPGLLSSTVMGARVGTRFNARDATLGELRSLSESLRRDDLLIAITRPTGDSDDPLPIGIAGRGFDGNLTSDSTRTDGYVLSTDVAPTVLDWLGIAVPSEMSGQPIHSEGHVDVASIESLQDRMGVISERRGPVIGWTLLIWVVALGLIAFGSRGRLAPAGVRVAALSVVYLPLVLLLAAAIGPSQDAELLLAMVVAPLLAALTLLALGGYRALGVAAAITVAAYAVDVVAGSPLTSLSLLGPNPGLGVRFYGIGNELEAILSVLVVAGTGAALVGFSPRASCSRYALAFVAVGLFAAAVFAAGRFGADVGAAIVFPAGAAVAAAAVTGRGPRSAAWLIVAAPLGVLALLALVDLVSGADAHLTRSVLDAGGLGELSEVAQRRLQLSAASFTRPVLLAFLPLVLVIGVLAVLYRDRLRVWLSGVPAMRAGLLGALAATAVGTLANDSGALLLVVGTAYLLVFTGFAWSQGVAASTTTKSYSSGTHTRDPAT